MNECGHPDIVEVSLVTGRIISQPCRLQRTKFGMCGVEGRWFKRRMPLTERLGQMVYRMWTWWLTIPPH
jgi:hypothetical protein